MTQNFGLRLLKTGLTTTVVAGVAVGAAWTLAPGPVSGMLDHLRDRFGWTQATCQISPGTCLTEKATGLARRQAEVRTARMRAEAGLRAIEGEERRVRDQADANLGLQSLLRQRVNDAVLRGVERVAFLERALTMPEAQQQAAMLVAEQAQFEETLNRMIPPRREALHRARQEAVLTDGRITTALATLEAEQALLESGRAMKLAGALLSEMAGVERQAEASVGQVRSTLELARIERAGEQRQTAPAFDFLAWRNGRLAGG